MCLEQSGCCVVLSAVRACNNAPSKRVFCVPLFVYAFSGIMRLSIRLHYLTEVVVSFGEPVRRLSNSHQTLRPLLATAVFSQL